LEAQPKTTGAKAGLAGALAFVALLTWIASTFGATRAGFLGAAMLFGAVQMICLFALLRVRRISNLPQRATLGFFCFFTILFGIVVELIALAASIPAPR
jgi:hypothetical protein